MFIIYHFFLILKALNLLKLKNRKTKITLKFDYNANDTKFFLLI